MATRKRNEWLDADESEEEEQDYESEDEGRAHILRSSKRQKVTHNSDSEPSEDEDDPETWDAEAFDEEHQNDDHEDFNDEDKNAELARLETLAATLPTDLNLQSNKLTKPLPPPSQPKKDKSGVIYLSRVPPFMKPAVLRSLLTPYGTVGRIFLTPESSTQRQQRLKSGGTRRKLYLDGWVEFLSKKDAKFVAENLNAQTMGGKKRGRWHDEVWNIRYLNRVKWSTLVEQIQNENAERTARLRLEIAQSKKENAKFLENIERGKMISGIETKRKLKGKDREDKGVEVVDEATDKPAKKERRSNFKQHAMTTKAEKKPEPGQDVHREKVLSSIF